jgi:hypothetical protein
LEKKITRGKDVILYIAGNGEEIWMIAGKGSERKDMKWAHEPSKSACVAAVEYCFPKIGWERST